MDSNKKIAIVVSSLPNTFHGGGALTAFSIVQLFCQYGFRVEILCWPSADSEVERKSKQQLEQLEVGVTFLKKIPSRNFFGFCNTNKKSLFPYAASRNEVEKILRFLNPDCVLMYHWDALSAACGITDMPKIGIVGDPVNLPYLYRKWFYTEFDRFSLQRLKNLIRQRKYGKQIDYMIDFLSACDVSGAFAAHHAQMLRDWGAKRCRYFRTPLIDPFLSKDAFVIQKRQLALKFKILLLGHLKGIATLSGISLFAQEIFPCLLEQLGADNFEVHIVGGYFENLPKKLKDKLIHPCIKLRGHVSPIDEEFLTSHVLLVPTPIELGIRVRIITAFSYGRPVVAHIANTKGIPELKHNENALIASSGIGLAKEIFRLSQNIELQKNLGLRARQTYEEKFSLSSAGRAIVTVAEELCREKKQSLAKNRQ